MKMTVVIGSSDEPAPTEICPNTINGDDSAVPEQTTCSTTEQTAEDQLNQQPSRPQQTLDTEPQQSQGGEIPERKLEADPKADIDVRTEEIKEDALDDKETPEEVAPVDPDAFPEDELQKLEEMINRSRWVVPVLPNGELEVLLLATLRLARKGLDEKNELCMRFVRDGLTTSFVKILTDEAVSGWKFEIHKCIYHNCVLLIELCVAKLCSNCPELLDLLALLFNPDNKFHHYNASRGMDAQESTLFAKSGDARSPKGWLVNLINRFGTLGGFEVLRERFEETSTDKPLPLGIIVSLVKPFGQCCQFLTKQTISTYLMPIVEKVPMYLHKLSDEQLKKDTKNDSLSMLVRWLRYIASCAGQTAMVERLEEFRLQMLLKLLQISSFNGKMNALNEVNKAITNVMLYRQSGHSQRCVDTSDVEYLTSNKMVGWIRDNNVLSIVLRDSLHQPQYVEKLEKILRFMIKEKALTLGDLDAIWDSQSGATRHEAIVKNIHDLLAKLAWDFSPEQLEHVFESCFKKSWATAQTKKEREKLIELIRRLAEDDKDGMMAHKVLQLLWGLAHNQQVPNEIVDLALSAHLKILDYSCCQDRSAQKQHWLEECVQELRNNDLWVIPALKHIREICVLYQETQQQTAHGLAPRGASQGPARSDIISALQNKHTLVVLVTMNLVEYVEESKKFVTSHPDPGVAREGHRYPHNVNVYERLRFLRFLLKDGQLWLCAPQATQIWKCLAENGAYPSDREACFNWFAKLMGDEPDLDPDINKQFFEENVLKFDPSQLTESGIHCFQRFFKMVNVKEGNLVPMKGGMSASPNGANVVYVDNVELVGQDYLWKVVLLAPDEVSARAAEILRNTTTHLGPKLHEARTALHEEFVTTCFDRIRMAHDTWKCLQPSERAVELRKMRRLLRLLTQYVQQCDGDYPDRLYLPLHRALRGKEMRATIQICSSSSGGGGGNNSTGTTGSASNGSGSSDEIVVSTHTNETLFSLKRRIEHRLDTGKLELLHGEESLSDKMHSCMGSIFPTLRVTLRAKAAATTPSLGLAASAGAGSAGAHQSSPASSSSSESESPSPPQLSHSSQLLLENQLPGVLIARKEDRVRFCLTLCDIAELHDVTWALLQQIPSSSDVIAQLKQLAAGEPGNLASHFRSSSSISELQYNLEVLYSMLLPATDPLSEEALALQCNCIRSGVLHSLADMLLKRAGEIQSMELPHSVQLVLLKLYRFLLAILIRNNSTAVAEPHEDSVVSSVAEKVVDTLQAQQKFVIKPLCASAVESILGTLIRSSWSLAELDVITLDDVHICQESLYTLTASLRLLSDAKITGRVLQNTEYIFYLLLRCPNASVRQAAEDTFYNLGTQFGPLNFITSLYAQVNGDVVTNHERSSEYFSLIGRLLGTLKAFADAKHLFEMELSWLRAAKDNAQPPQLTEGHLIVAISVCRFLTRDEKARHKDFVRELLEDFVFPASKAFVALKNPELIGGVNEPTGAVDTTDIGKLKSRDRKELLTPEGVTAKSVCVNASITNAALDLVVELCCCCLSNLEETNRILSYMFYSDKSARITEWEYLPAVGPRPAKGFVGLKNAGATCYMNSVLQQLYMIKPIRKGLLSLKDIVSESDLANGGNDAADYNLGVLKQVMIIFGFLEKSRQQFYVPQGFWNHFRLWGEPVNVREQHDALEFFNCLVDSIDEALKSLNRPTILSKVLGGTFADQKICKGCPHRYSREESFTTLNIDIRNHSNLLDSLEQYVKGDLLEGPNAYHCEQCSKKVDTVKRLCIKSLPPILAIQLKRFDYDWDRECAIKFNDYFEFPRDLDMEPYTVQGLARREGEPVESDRADRPEHGSDSGTLYELSGIVVHSGQASGGHYYSYIKTDGQWYKFDDGEVCESKMETHEEMKNQCFGGDYVSEMFDHISKRMSCRRQKRWWNAYILFYERVDIAARVERQLRLERPNEAAVSTLPPAIEMSVWQQNLQYTHVHVQFTPEFFRFVKKLVGVNAKHLPCDSSASGVVDCDQFAEVPEVPLLSMQLADKFLFSTYFHTKKVLRGNMTEWLSTLIEYFSKSLDARTWFGHRLTSVTSPGHGIICTYLLECPVEEVRHCFAHLLANLTHCLLRDTPNDSPDFNPLAVHILNDVMQLLAKDVCDYGRHVNHYFLFYSLYAGMGSQEKMHLIKSEVPLAFIRLALDDGAIKYQYAELGKLYQTIATLLHCLDVTQYQAAADEGRSLNSLPANPYARNILAIMDERIAEYLFQPSSFIKKLLEDANAMDEVVDLLKYLCWENQEMSRNVLTELLWFIAYVCTYEVRPFLDILLHILTIQDSWQMIRINMTLKGMRPDREALFDIIERAKSHYQKRAYQCIKFMVELLARVPEAFEQPETRQRLQAAVEWTRTELDRKHYPGSGQQQPPWTQVSNETSNGYFLERSASAVDMVSRAGQLLAQLSDGDEQTAHLAGGDTAVVATTSGPLSTAAAAAGTGTASTASATPASGTEFAMKDVNAWGDSFTRQRPDKKCTFLRVRPDLLDDDRQPDTLAGARHS